VWPVGAGDGGGGRHRPARPAGAGAQLAATAAAAVWRTATVTPRGVCCMATAAASPRRQPTMAGAAPAIPSPPLRRCRAGGDALALRRCVFSLSSRWRLSPSRHPRKRGAGVLGGRHLPIHVDGRRRAASPARPSVLGAAAVAAHARVVAAASAVTVGKRMWTWRLPRRIASRPAVAVAAFGGGVRARDGRRRWRGVRADTGKRCVPSNASGWPLVAASAVTLRTRRPGWVFRLRPAAARLLGSACRMLRNAGDCITLRFVCMRLCG